MTSAIQINQGASNVAIVAPVLILGTETTLSVIFLGPSIDDIETYSSLPFTLATPPTGWTITAQTLLSETSVTFSVSVPIDAAITSTGAYAVVLFDGDGNYYAQWFDVIAADAEPVVPTITQVAAGSTLTLPIPIASLTYKSFFVSVEPPTGKDWVDNGTQTIPYQVPFNDLPAPAGWLITLTSLSAGVAYQSTVAVPSDGEFGTYTITVSDSRGGIYEASFEVIPAVPQFASPPFCTCQTGFDIEREVQLRLGENRSTTALQQAQLYPRHVRRALNEIGKKTWTLYRNAVTDIVSGQFEYTPPARPYELRTVCINDGNGNIEALSSLTPQQADNKFYNWRAQVSQTNYQGIPEFYVEEGDNTYVLLPTPNYSQQDGVLVGGYYGVDTYWDMPQCSPLPRDDDFNYAAVLRVTIERCIEMGAKDPYYNAAMIVAQREYKELMDRLYREAMRRTASRRGGLVPNKIKRVSSWGGGWGWGA